MHIIFLHGLLSTPETSQTAKAVKEHFAKLEYHVSIPDYRPNVTSMIDIKAFLKNYVNDLSQDGEEIVFIGISLGGFWALEMANMTPNSSCILLNPSLVFYGWKGIPKNDLPISLFVNLDDEIIDSKIALNYLKDRAFIKTFKKGAHRMNNIEEVLPEIEKAVFNFVL